MDAPHLHFSGSGVEAAHGEGFRGVAGGPEVPWLALVPDDRSAQWFQLARHMRVVSHIPAGSRVLEQYGTGAWRSVPARRDLILLAYPRTVGTAAAVVGPSAGAQFQAHVGQMVESRMFAQFPELEPEER